MIAFYLNENKHCAEIRFYILCAKQMEYRNKEN